MEENGMTPLGYALRSIRGPHFRKQTVVALLDLGANPNGADSRGNSYLSWTIEYPDIFQLLLRHGAAITRSVLVAAIQKQDVGLVEMLLSNGADPNQREVGEEHPEIKHSENCFSMARSDPDSQDETYLIEWMAQAHDISGSKNPKVEQIFKMLLEYGANPFAPYLRTTVLHRMIENRTSDNSYRSGHNSRLDLFLSQPGLKIDTRDAEGMTLLLLAARRDFGVSNESIIELIEKLLAKGADIYARDNSGRSALHYACYFKTRCGFILSKAKELLDSSDSEGQTPLHYALNSDMKHHTSHFSVANAGGSACALINAGADVTRTDHKGITPLHLALHRSDWTISATDSIGGSGRDLFNLLVAKGADANARTFHSDEPPIFGYVRNSSIRAATDLSALGSSPESKQSMEWPKYEMDKRRLEHGAAVRKEGLLWDFFEQQGVDLRAVNGAGEDLLHLIAQDADPHQRSTYPDRRVARFRYLVGKKGLDPALEDGLHRTPLDLAAATGKEDILELFNGEDGL